MLAWRIAIRYFLGRQGRQFIQWLTTLSMLGVAVGCMALMVVLSGFNGLQQLIRSQYSTFDPSIKIVPANGKFFSPTPAQLQAISKVSGIASWNEMLEDNVLLEGNNSQVVVKIRGLGSGFATEQRLKPVLLTGKPIFQENNVDMVVIGAGIQQMMGLSVGNYFEPVIVWYPQHRTGGTINPNDAFTKRPATVAGMFSIDQNYDQNYVFASLPYVEDLMDAPGKRSAIEIMLQPSVSPQAIIAQLQPAFGTTARLLDIDEQHADVNRVLKIEKLFVFLALTFILIIACFNLFVSINMIVIEKKRDLRILFAMGADTQLVKGIILRLSVFIGGIGAASGLLLGMVIVRIQQQFGFLKLGTLTMDQAYPMAIDVNDVLVILATALVLCFLAGLYPANRAAKLLEAIN